MMSTLKKNIGLDEAKNLAIKTLKTLIKTPSFSKNENAAADVMANTLNSWGYQVHRKMNNVWVYSHNFDAGKPTLLLNSHLDTVKPSGSWQTDPFMPVEENGKLIGLGSNDAGGPLVSLMAVFLLAQHFEFNFNLIFAATAEEEISGKNGIESIIPELGKIKWGIIGEPTQMEMAIAEKGLLVLDCKVKGKAGHAARTGGINAISLAMDQVKWFHTFVFPKSSDMLGDVKMTVTQINAGTQHNVIPDSCDFVVDVRTNECYTNNEVYQLIKKNCNAEIKPRSLRMNSSGIAPDDPLVLAAKNVRITCFGSPTTSDQAVISTFPTVKMGPGDSNRSHTANEFIFKTEIESGIDTYLELLKSLSLILNN